MITGLLLGALTRTLMTGGKPGQTRDTRSPLLRMNHPIRTVHLIPGRVRFRAPTLVGRTQFAPRVAEAVSRIQGVRSADADPRSGSVLITYDAERLEPELLYAALIRLLDLEKELNKPPMSIARKEGTAALNALNKSVFDSTQGLLDLYAIVGILGGTMALNQLILRHINLGSLLAAAFFTRNRGEVALGLLRQLGKTL